MRRSHATVHELLPGLLHCFSRAAFLHTEYCASDDKVSPCSVRWPEEWGSQQTTLTKQSITLAVLISCHWPHCISCCSGGTGSVHPVAHLLKLACCFANWEFPVYKDEQALLERFLLFGYSKKMESINHQQSNPKRIPVNPDCELQQNLEVNPPCQIPVKTSLIMSQTQISNQKHPNPGAFESLTSAHLQEYPAYAPAAHKECDCAWQGPQPICHSQTL